MSELINTAPRGGHFQRQLLTTVSALALLTMIGAQHDAKAADSEASRPTVWIELGGQLERVNGQGQAFAPPFASAYPDSAALADGSLTGLQRPPRFAKGFEGEVTFVPRGSDWVLSASVLYGRANSNRRVHQQTPGKPIASGFLKGNQYYDPAPNQAFSDVRVKDRESHVIVDFKVGKDVGLGAFGTGGESTFSAGVRFAQFATAKDVELKLRPDMNQLPGGFFNSMSTFYGSAEITRSFQAIGPSVSWEGSAAIAGRSTDGVTFDWGIAAAVLFGRQKADVTHNTFASHFNQQNILYPVSQLYQTSPAPSARHRSVVVPNLGGFAGVSFRRASAKISLGYRADFFFGAMDTGIDSRKREAMSFHGPFATISIGLGG